MAGIALKPGTTISNIKQFILNLDYVLCLSVQPGFGGQSFINNTYKKIIELNELKIKTNSNFLIEIDGGVNSDNAPKLLECGADVLVAGSFVFKSTNPISTIANLKSI